MFKNKNIFFMLSIMLLLVISTGIVSAADVNDSFESYENENLNDGPSQQDMVETENNNLPDEYEDNEVTQNTEEIQNTRDEKYLELNVSVVNETISIISDSGNEVVIKQNITQVNGTIDVTKFGADYAYADENGVYTILGSEIRRVMKLDSYCQQIYGYVPKYTFFREINSNIKYVISREKWNVIARSLNSYHVNQGYNSVNTPYAITVNLSGQSRYYCVYYDAQEWINGHQYTCGPTAMSMISQALNCYSSERKLAGVYLTTSRYGTEESDIIKYSPTVHMKLSNIVNTKSEVKSAILSGKMIFWHINGHYMCAISYNSLTDKFLCLNPSGPSHNINAVQWATWTEMMNTDKSLKENGFMAVTPYWNLTANDKLNAEYYYYNMGGQYIVSANNEYCNDNNDNEINVTVNAPSSIPSTTNQTKLVIFSKIGNNPAHEYNVSVYLNSNLIGTPSVVNATVNMTYTLPTYAGENLNVTLVCSSFHGDMNVSVVFNKYSAGNTFTNTTLMNLESISVTDVVAKKDDTINFTAYVTDKRGNPVTNGKVVFKLNGVTIKDNGNPIKVRVVNGTASLTFNVPAYSAKSYLLTSVYGYNGTRLETNGTFVILKSDTEIVDANVETSDSALLLTARVVDENGNKVERETKITVKIDSRTVVDKVKVADGIINMSFDVSPYKAGTHNITILAGENGLYKFSSLNMTFNKPVNESAQLNTSIVGLTTSVNDKKLNIVAYVVDENANNVTGNLKLSVKINSITRINKAVITDGVLNTVVDISDYSIGTHNLTLITGPTSSYKSTTINSTFILT